ncbi:MAG: metallophosphoesterase [Thermomicrobiales bacterium]
MRVAVLSDIHGFSIALQTVLADIDRQGPFDAIVVAGDLCETGPAPGDVLDILQSREDLTVIHGNTDRYLVEEAQPGASSRERAFTLEQIGDDGVRYLANLPFSRRITPSGGRGVADDLLVVHANPQNLEDALHPELPEAEVRALLGAAQMGAVAFGHIHIAYIRTVADRLLVDVSAVGNPKDGDLRCKYGILTWDAPTVMWSAEIRRLDYPLDETEEQIRSSGLPKPEKTIRKLRQASYSQ